METYKYGFLTGKDYHPKDSEKVTAYLVDELKCSANAVCVLVKPINSLEKFCELHTNKPLDATKLNLLDKLFFSKQKTVTV